MFTRIINIGVDNDLEFYQKREIKILNLFSSVSLLGIALGFCNTLIVGEVYTIRTIVFEFIASLLILLLNYKKYYNYSIYLFVISVNLTVMDLNSYYGFAGGNYLYYFPLIFCVALLHNPKK